MSDRTAIKMFITDFINRRADDDDGAIVSAELISIDVRIPDGTLSGSPMHVEK